MRRWCLKMGLVVGVLPVLMALSYMGMAVLPGDAADLAKPAQYRQVQAGGSIEIRLRSTEGGIPPAEMVLSDPSAAMVGYDPRDDYRYREIPGATYSHGPDSIRLFVPNAMSGNYSLRIIGVEYGRYDVYMTGFDRTGARADIRFTRLLEPGRVNHFLILYTNVGGARISARQLPGGE